MAVELGIERARMIEVVRADLEELLVGALAQPLGEAGVSESYSGERWSIAPAQNVRPITEPRCSTIFAPAGSRSMRAPIIACRESGMRSPPSAPSSTNIRTVSSTKSGFPSVLSRRRVRTCSAT